MKMANLGPAGEIQVDGVNLTPGSRIRFTAEATVREAEGDLVVDLDSVGKITSLASKPSGKRPLIAQMQDEDEGEDY